jgi:hypothetical protein
MQGVKFSQARLRKLFCRQISYGRKLSEPFLKVPVTWEDFGEEREVND